jgi:hypothetical protein
MRRNEHVYWRCVSLRCPVTITTLNNVHVTVSDDYNNGSDHLKYAASAFVNRGHYWKRCPPLKVVNMVCIKGAPKCFRSY